MVHNEAIRAIAAFTIRRILAIFREKLTLWGLDPDICDTPRFADSRQAFSM